MIAHFTAYEFAHALVDSMDYAGDHRAKRVYVEMLALYTGLRLSPPLEICRGSAC